MRVGAKRLEIDLDMVELIHRSKAAMIAAFANLSEAQRQISLKLAEGVLTTDDSNSEDCGD